MESEIEDILYKILIQIGILDENKHKTGEPYFVSQFSIGEQYYPARCKGVHWCEYCENSELLDTNILYCGDIDVDCEHRIDGKLYPLYILDFAIFAYGKKICIECDGFYFHRSNNNQIEKDKNRDKYLIDRNWVVKRYAGTTIISRPNIIKKDLLNLISSIKPLKQIKMI
jgi:hypothetical protein